MRAGTNVTWVRGHSARGIPLCCEQRRYGVPTTHCFCWTFSSARLPASWKTRWVATDSKAYVRGVCGVCVWRVWHSMACTGYPGLLHGLSQEVKTDKDKKSGSYERGWLHGLSPSGGVDTAHALSHMPPFPLPLPSCMVVEAAAFPSC